MGALSSHDEFIAGRAEALVRLKAAYEAAVGAQIESSDTASAGGSPSNADNDNTQ
jgi:hypothetical protein